jgi:hypothetical protein
VLVGIRPTRSTAPLRHALPGHVIETAFDKGWGKLLNGELLELDRRVWPSAHDLAVAERRHSEAPYRARNVGEMRHRQQCSANRASAGFLAVIIPKLDSPRGRPQQGDLV